jgi:hypothetical protein
LPNKNERFTVLPKILHPHLNTAKLRIDSQDLKEFVPETYPAAEPDALDDIVLIDVVVPPDAV